MTIPKFADLFRKFTRTPKPEVVAPEFDKAISIESASTTFGWWFRWLDDLKKMYWIICISENSTTVDNEIPLLPLVTKQIPHCSPEPLYLQDVCVDNTQII